MNPDELDREGFAALHRAVKEGSPGNIQSLIDAGADVDVTTSPVHNAATPAMIAVLQGEAMCLKTLLKNSANVNKTDTNNKTVLILCIELNKLDCLGVLAGERDLFRREPNENDPIELAVANNRPECLVLLLMVYKETSLSWRLRRGDLFHATLKGYERCVEILLNEFGSIPEESTALHAAAATGNLECLTLLLQHCQPSDIDARDYWNATPLWYSSLHGHVNCMEKLLEAGAEPFVYAEDPYNRDFDEELSSLQAAFMHEHYCGNCTQQAFCAGYDAIFAIRNEDRWRCDECYNGNCSCEVEACIQMLVNKAKSALADAINEKSKSVAVKFLSSGVEVCVCRDNAEALKTLLVAGADPNKPVKIYPSVETVPLYLTTHARALSCMKILMSYGKTFLSDKAPLNPHCNENLDGDLCVGHVLSGAILQDWHVGINYLLDSGMDVNTVISYYANGEKETPMLCAIDHSSIATMKLLLKRGASSFLSQNRQWIFERNGWYHPSTLEEALVAGKLLIAAGFPKDKIFQGFIGEHTGWKGWITDEQHKKIEDFVDENGKNLTLQECCRDMICKHLVLVNKQTNLFHLVPRLEELPVVMRQFLLYDMKLDV